MDYDEAIQHADPGPEIKEKFFRDYILPLLKNKKSPKRLQYFFHQGYLAWRLGVNTEDVRQVKFVEWLCEELRKINEAELIEVISSIISQHYEVGVRTAQAERNSYNSSAKGDKLMNFSDSVRLYKVLFENEFRLHSTIPYLYMCRVYGRKHKATNAADFVNVGASEKFQALSDTRVPLPRGDISKLCVGFDNQIRNAGEGHDRWEVTDKDMLVLPIVDPKTGSEKGKVELSENELKGLIKQCRKSLWILKNGYLLFLENNEDLDLKLKDKPILKIREIEALLEQFADNRWFDLKQFEINEERTLVTLAIRYRPRVVGTKTQVFFGSGEAYDLIERERFVPYEYQMLDIVKTALRCLGSETLPKVIVKMYGEKDASLGTVEYKPVELSKLLKEEGELEIPRPSKGSVPDIKCRLVVFIKVPYGTRDTWEKLIKENERE